MNDLTPSPSPVIRVSAFAMRWLLRLLLALLLLLVFLWGALQYFIVPRISDFRPRLEAIAESVIGVPVRLGQISAYSGGLIPSFELRNVKLLDAQGRTALELPRVLAALSWTSVLRVDFDQLYLDQPTLEIRRLPDGRVFVAGLEVSSGPPGADTRMADWFFSQREFVIRGATVRWIDEQRAVEPLELAALEFVMRNGARSHDLRIDATPPAGWGQRFQMVGKFKRPLLSLHAGRWADWDGQVFADSSRVDISQLRRYVDLGGGVEMREGTGAVRAWVDVARGVLVGGTADLAMADVVTTLGSGLDSMDLRSLSGRVGGKRLEGGFQFFTEGLQFQTRDGLRWPGGNVSVSHAQAAGQPSAAGELRADRLDLAALSQIASRLPLGTVTHGALQAHPVKGLVETVQARWQGPLDAWQKYEVRGRVSGLEVAAWVSPEPEPANATGAAGSPATGVPGIRGATLDIEMNQAGGKGRLVLAKGALELPGVFEEPLVPFDRLSADAQWQVQGDRIVVQQFSTKFANADAEGEFSGNWQTSDPERSAGKSRFPGVLDLKGQFSRVNGARVHRYLPQGIHADVRHYVRDSVIQGDVGNLSVRVRGDLYDLPFADPKRGEFRIAGKVRNTSYAFVPRASQPAGQAPWPVVTDLAGELVFDRASMRVLGASGRLAGATGLQVNRIEAQIPDIMNTVTVAVSLETRGPATSLLGVVNGSPIGDLTGKALSQATATGDLAGRVQLNLPISALDKSKVQGSVTLAANDVRITPDTPLLGRARGLVTFSESGFSIVGAQARMLGGDLKLDGGTRLPVAGGASGAATSVVLRAQGSVTAEGLRQAPELGFVARLAQSATGATTYNGVLGIHRGVPELSISSNLQGLGLSLPAPLNKPAEAVLPLRFSNVLLAESQTGPAGSARLRDQLQLDLAGLASVAYVRDLSGTEPRVLQGSIAVGLAPGESAPMPAEGVVANINLAKVNFDAWGTALSKASGVPLVAPVAPAAKGPPVLGYLPTVMAVRAAELTAGGRVFRSVVIGGGREDLTWRANVSADQLNGYLEYRQPSPAGAGRVYARLAHLTMEPGAGTDVEAVLEQQPASIPALDIVVEDFGIRGKKLGRVEIEAINRGGGATPSEGAVREWRLNKFNVLVPEASFAATGNWAVASPLPGETEVSRAARAEQRPTAHHDELQTQYCRFRRLAGTVWHEGRDPSRRGKA